MSMDEREKLKLMLAHWVEHNREHGEEFREWAEKARAMGEAGAADEILAAARAMDEAGNLLTKSRERLEVA